MRDRVYSEKLTTIAPFEFNAQVAAVFDDMVARSIPFYHEIHRLLVDIASKIRKKDVIVYDLGCSTGSTMVVLDRFFKSKGVNAHFIGVDQSAPMLEKCQQKLSSEGVHSYELLRKDVTSLKFHSADLIVMNYTLQFVPVRQRAKLVKRIYKHLHPSGFFVLSEKIKSNNHTVQDLITELYYDFKERNGYSRLEIAQKREALENVLIPLSTKEQLRLLKQAGFHNTDVLFRWYNFACFLGIK